MTDKKDKALKLALEALEKSRPIDQSSAVQHNKHVAAIAAIKEALAEQQAKYCSACQGHGQVDTGINESPVTICNACNGTGLRAQPAQ